MGEKMLDIQGVAFTEKELQTFHEWLQRPGRKLLDRFIGVQRDDCHDRAKSVTRPMYSVSLTQKRIVPWEYRNEERVANLAMEMAYDNILDLADMIKQDVATLADSRK